MNAELSIAIISMAGTVMGSVSGILIANRLSNYRIGELERKVERLSHLMEQFCRLEENTHRLEDRIQMAHHRIDELRH